MAPATVARRLALLVTSLRGTPTGREDALVDVVRKRLSDLPKKATAAQQQAWLAFGLSALVDYCVEAFGLNTLTAMSDASFGDRVFELFKVLANRTRLTAKFSEVLDDDLEWQEQVRVLVLHRDGTPAPNPLLAPPLLSSSRA